MDLFNISILIKRKRLFIRFMDLWITGNMKYYVHVYL